jgi:hypothetical protein
MGRKNRRGKRRIFQRGHCVRPAMAFSDSDVFCGEYHRLTIIPLPSKPKGSAMPLMTASALIALAAGVVIAVAR